MGSLFRKRPPRSIRCSHILVKSQALADQIVEQLEEGADFADLARRHSICETRGAGGDLGVIHRGEMPRIFELAAFHLEPGEVSAPIPTRLGFHLIRRSPNP